MNDSKHYKYIETFCRRWNAYLGDNQDMRANIFVIKEKSLIAFEFFIADKGDEWDLSPKINDVNEMLLKYPDWKMNVPLVSDHGILVVKPYCNLEEKLHGDWTEDEARVDADSSLCMRMNHEFEMESNKAGEQCSGPGVRKNES